MCVCVCVCVCVITCSVSVQCRSVQLPTQTAPPLWLRIWPDFLSDDRCQPRGVLSYVWKSCDRAN